MEAKVRAVVRGRAGDRCEYCQRRQIDSPLIPLQIEHIVPRKHGGSDELDNLAMACPDCNLRKGSNLTGIDPTTSEITPLFNPRSEAWGEHFEWNGVRLDGKTAVGRTTVRVLDMNAPSRLRLRLAGQS